MLKKINEKEIPYKELEELGISKEQFLDLPKEVLNHIMTGRLSPLIMLELKDKKKDMIYKLPAKIAFDRDKEGNVHLYAFPQRKDIKNDLNLKEDEIEKLKNKEVVLTTVERNGKKEKVYVQMDEETKAIITLPKNEIHIPEAIGDIVLGEKDKENIRKGNLIELEKGDTKMTIGVDLNSRGGYKVVDGDMSEWKDKKLIEWDMNTPGVTGYWKTNENILRFEEYVKEERGITQESIHEKEQEEIKNEVESEVSLGLSRGYCMKR